MEPSSMTSIEKKPGREKAENCQPQEKPKPKIQIISIHQNVKISIPMPTAQKEAFKETTQKEPSPLSDRFKYSIHALASFVSSNFRDQQAIKLCFHAISLYVEYLVPYNLFENLIYIITKAEHKQQISQILLQIKQISAEIRSKNSKTSSSSKQSQNQIQNNHIISPILQLIICSQFLMNDSSQIFSFLKCLKLFSKQLINEKQAVDWLSAIVPQFAKYFYFALVDEDRISFDPYNLFQVINKMNDKTKQLAFSPVVLQCFSLFKKDPCETIYDDLIAAANSPYQLRMDQMKLEISQMKSITYFLAYTDNMKYNDTKTVTKAMESASKALYGNFANDKLFGTKIFGQRCKEIGKKEHQRHVQLESDFLEKVQRVSADYRTVYAKKFSHHSIERNIFYNDVFHMKFNKNLFQTVISIAEYLSKDISEIQEAFSEFKTALYSDTTFFCTLKYAFSFVYLNEACRICANESEDVLQSIVSTIMNSSPPYVLFGHTELANVDIPFRGFLRSLKHNKEKHEKFGKTCKMTDHFFIAKVQIVENEFISLNLVENIISLQE